MKSLFPCGLLLAFVFYFSPSLSAQQCSGTIDIVVIWPPTAPVAKYLTALHAKQIDSSFPSGARLIRMPECGNNISLNGSIWDYSDATGAVGVVYGGTQGVADENYEIYYPETDNPEESSSLPLFACGDNLQRNLLCPVGSQTTRVAVLDTGVGLDMTNVNSALSYNFVDNDRDFQSKSAHGPMVLSILNHFSGLKDILVYKVLDDSGRGKIWYVIKAIDKAINDEVGILNMSFIAKRQVISTEDLKTPLGALISNASSERILCLSAAGNDDNSINRNSNGDKYVPAAEPFVNNFPIGASDCQGAKANFSNYDVLTAFIGTDVVGYDAFMQPIQWSGTSFSTPIVAGAIVQLWSNLHLREVDFKQLAYVIEKTASRDITWVVINNSEGNIDISAVYNVLVSTSARSIVDLQAKEVNNDAVLTWKIDNIKKINHLKIEKSINLDNFVSVSNIPVHDNQKKFEWTDNQMVEKLNYYRIIVQYEDNSQDTTKMVAINTDSKNSLLEVGPNPTRDVLNVHFGNNQSGLSLYLVNIASQKIVLTKNVEKEMTDIALSLENVQNGVFELLLMTPNKQILDRRKIIIMR